MYGRPHIVTNLGKILWPNCTGNPIEETIAAADIEINVPTEALVQERIETLLNNNSTESKEEL